MAVSRNRYSHDADAVLDYVVLWADWLDGDTITESDWTIPTGITSPSQTFTDTSTTVWVAEGDVGQVYELTNHITTTAGREDDRTITITIVEK